MMDKHYKLCKYRGDCLRAFWNDCSFGSHFNNPTDRELENPKSVCWRYGEDADATGTQYQP